MSDTPRTDAFAFDDNGDPREAYGFMRTLEAENAILRAAMGVEPDETIPLDQRPQHGSVLVVRKGSRVRTTPISEEFIELAAERDALKAAAELVQYDMRTAGIVCYKAMKALVAALQKP